LINTSCEISSRAYASTAVAGRLVSVRGEGSYLRLIEFVYHSTLGLRVIKKKKESTRVGERQGLCPERQVPRERGHVNSRAIESIAQLAVWLVGACG